MSSAATHERADVGGPTVADQVAALLENPNTPADIYNAVAEVVIDITSRQQLSREVLRVSLPLALGKSQPAVADHGVDAQEAEVNVQAGQCSCKGTGVSDSDCFTPITLERARELADFITNYDDDEQCHALVTLLEGIAHALYHGDRLDVEGLIIYAERAAYANTMHGNDAFHRFAALSTEEVRAARERRGQDEK